MLKADGTLDLTGTKPTYEQVVARLDLLCTFVRNVGEDMRVDKSYGKKANRETLARTMRYESLAAKELVTRAKVGK